MWQNPLVAHPQVTLEAQPEVTVLEQYRLWLQEDKAPVLLVSLQGL